MSALLALATRVPAGAWLLAAVLAWGGWNRWQAIGARADADRAAASARQHAADVEAERAARAAEQAAQRAAKEVMDGHALRAREARADAAAARGELDRLRGELAAAQQGGAAASAPGAAGGTHGASVVGQVVAECAGALVQVAEAADACEGQLTGLQEWVRAVSGSVGPNPPDKARSAH